MGSVVLCGSALKNVGIQPLLDAVVAYLPGPKPLPFPSKEAEAASGGMVALAFKVQHRPVVGPLVFIRVYRGELHRRDVLFNVNRGCKEKMTRLVVMKANVMHDVESLPEGSIGAAAGLQVTATGETLSKSILKPDLAALGHAQLPNIVIPESVFVCSIEAESAKDEDDLKKALACIEREDPSIRVTIDAESGQTLISGMGELHLEVTHQRLIREYGVKAQMGDVRISYRETCEGVSSADNVAFDRIIGAKRHFAACSVHVEPLEPGSGTRITVQISPDSSNNTIANHNISGSGNLAKMSKNDSSESKKAPAQLWAETAAQQALTRGPLLGFPLTDISVTVSNLRSIDTPTETAVSGCVRAAISQALSSSSPKLLEPVMDVAFRCSESSVGPVVSDVSSRRRGQVKEVSGQGRESVVSALVPLGEMVGYATALRTMTSGEASFEMRFARYQPMAAQAQDKVLKAMRGF